MEKKFFYFESDALINEMEIFTNNEIFVNHISLSLYCVDGASYCRVYESLGNGVRKFRSDLSFVNVNQ